MRPVLHGDVVTAARALLPAPGADHALTVRAMLDAAEAADIYRKHHGEPHPLWGNGSLMAAAAQHPLAPEPDLDDPDYCRCMRSVFDGLLVWYVDRADCDRLRR